MNNEEKQAFTAPLMLTSSFNQEDANTTSGMDVWNILEIQEIN